MGDPHPCMPRGLIFNLCHLAQTLWHTASPFPPGAWDVPESRAARLAHASCVPVGVEHGQHDLYSDAAATPG